MTPNPNQQQTTIPLHNDHAVQRKGDFFLLAHGNNSIASVYQWSNRQWINSFYYDGLTNGCSLITFAEHPYVVGCGSQGTFCWDAVSGAVCWHDPELTRAVNFVGLTGAEPKLLGFSIFSKHSKARALRRLHNGASAGGNDLGSSERLSDLKSSDGRFWADGRYPSRYAIFDGQRTTLRTNEGDLVTSLHWEAHREGVTTSTKTLSDGTVIHVTEQEFDFSNPHPSGLVAFGPEEVVALDGSQILCIGHDGRLRWSFPKPDGTVRSVEWVDGRWYALIAPSRERADVVELNPEGPRHVLDNCDGYSFVGGALLTRSLDVIEIPSGHRSEPFAEPPVDRAPCSLKLGSEPTASGYWDSPWSFECAKSLWNVIHSTWDVPEPQKREAGFLSISDELAETLEKLRRLGLGGLSPTLDIEDVNLIEASIGASLPDDVLAILSAQSSFFAMRWGISLNSLYKLWRSAELPAGLRAIAVRTNEREFTEGEGIREIFVDETNTEHLCLSSSLDKIFVHEHCERRESGDCHQHNVSVDRVLGPFTPLQVASGVLAARRSIGRTDCFLSVIPLSEKDRASDGEGQAIELTSLESAVKNSGWLGVLRLLDGHFSKLGGLEAVRKAGSKLKVGGVFKGVVKNVTDYGAFVDLDGLTATCRIEDMKLENGQLPSHVVRPGDEVMVEVLNLDIDSERAGVAIVELPSKVKK